MTADDPRTACGLLESEVRDLMERRVLAWVAVKRQAKWTGAVIGPNVPVKRYDMAGKPVKIKTVA